MSHPSKQITIVVQGIDCPDEVAMVERALRGFESVRDVKTNIMTGKVTVAYDGLTNSQEFVQAICKEGFSAKLETDSGDDKTDKAQKKRFVSVLVSGVATAAGMLILWTPWSSVNVQNGCFALAIISGAWFIVPKAISAAKRLRSDMNLLMVVAVTGAIGIGEWSEGAAVTFLFALSELLESYSVARARRAVKTLLDLSPETAFLKGTNGVEEVAVESVEVGETIVIRSGARIPLDGEVRSGVSSVNQAPITGESMPVEKSLGEKVFAGTINGEGLLEVGVMKGYRDTTLARIIHLIEEGQSQKAPSERAIDVFAKFYTPTVMVFAAFLFLIPTAMNPESWADWFYRSLVILVIACPCALVISTPVSIVSGLTAMARRGVLIKGGAHLESIGRLRALAVDKTGTITEGQPRVAQVIPINVKSQVEVVRIAAAIDTHSDHPLAQAIVRFATETGIEFPQSQNYRSNTGRGAEAQIDGHQYFISNHRFVHDLGLCSAEIEEQLEIIESQAQSVVIVGHYSHKECLGEILGIIGVGDTIRNEAREAISALHKVGVKSVVMLSGDNQKTAAAIAGQTGIDEVYGDLLPDQKISRVQVMMAQYKHVAMVGDGVNDAPAMAAASVSIAMGAAGTDTAIETADIALMQDNLLEIAKTIHLGRRTVRIIKGNIIFALLVKAVFLVLAVMGTTSLWLAILADTGATLIVIANALRLLKPSATK